MGRGWIRCLRQHVCLHLCLRLEVWHLLPQGGYHVPLEVDHQRGTWEGPVEGSVATARSWWGESRPSQSQEVT